MAYESVRAGLRTAVTTLQDYGLKRATAWAAELLLGLPAPDEVPPAPPKIACPSFTPPTDDLDDASLDVLQLAKCYLDNREFMRAAHLLALHFDVGPESLHSDSPRSPASAGSTRRRPPKRSLRARFLRWYALYLDGERRKETEGRAPVAGPATDEAPHTGNPHLQQLYGELTAVHTGAGGGGLDPFGMYIYGVVLRALGRGEEGADALVASVGGYPYNWSAWVELGTTVSDGAGVERLVAATRPSAGWPATAFAAHAFTAVGANGPALTALGALSSVFPGSPSLQARVATCLYHLRQFGRAGALFDRVAASDPFRLEDADTRSNILYVQGDAGALAALAARVFSLDKYRPETCAVVGNLCSSRGEHAKAALYFRRALRLDPGYAGGWTLLGHEYVELRNTAAAIQCYRRAVGGSPGDYRAWYGLGQTYEILALFTYAGYYFAKAAALRPYDGRMWVALGSAHEAAGRVADAVSCYLRAAGLRDREGTATLRLARLFRGLRQDGLAARYYAAYVAGREGAAAAGDGGGGGGGPAAVVGPEGAEALLFLARAALGQGRHADAEVYAGRVLTMPLLQEVQEARLLLNDVRRLQGAAAAAAAQRLGEPLPGPPADGQPEEEGPTACASM